VNLWFSLMMTSWYSFFCYVQDVQCIQLNSDIKPCGTSHYFILIRYFSHIVSNHSPLSRHSMCIITSFCWILNDDQNELFICKELKNGMINLCFHSYNFFQDTFQMHISMSYPYQEQPLFHVFWNECEGMWGHWWDQDLEPHFLLCLRAD